jgi:hypothetical protein
MDNSKEYILCAAWKLVKPYGSLKGDLAAIEIGYRHGDIYDKFGMALSLEPGAMGFFTSHGRFVSRVEAAQIAFEAGQIDESTAKWSAELVEQRNKIQYIGQKPKILTAGDWKPLASEDLY